MTKQIPLTQGKHALVSDSVFDYFNQWQWFAHTDQARKWYAQRTEYSGVNQQTIYMHRAIMNAPKGIQVDHIDGNGLNNTLENLRLCSHAENLRNRLLIAKNNTSGYKGVCWHKREKKYLAYITVNGKRIHLGYHNDPAVAAQVYDAAAKEHFGQFANTNF